ncbi:MAG: putative RDD family membrane protein YckC [Glaciecola sp.]|mgnify:CR=1 FL=1
MDEVEYGGFWIRTVAAIIDSVLVIIISACILTIIYGTDYWLSDESYQGIVDFSLSYLFPIVAVLVFWHYKSATPGKMVTNLTIVDAKTGRKPTTGQFIGRYVAYYISIIPFLLGIIWVGVDKRKQGWHDKLAGTVVIRNKIAKTATIKS